MFDTRCILPVDGVRDAHTGDRLAECAYACLCTSCTSCCTVDGGGTDGCTAMHSDCMLSPPAPFALVPPMVIAHRINTHNLPRRSSRAPRCSAERPMERWRRPSGFGGCLIGREERAPRRPTFLALCLLGLLGLLAGRVACVLHGTHDADAALL